MPGPTPPGRPESLDLPPPWRSALLPAGLFLVLALLWIVLSDRLLLALAPTPGAFATLQTWKGSFFVAATAALLFLLLKAQFARRNRETRRIAAAGDRLRALVQESPLAVVEFDREFRITGWSPRAEELFGWRRDEVLGLTIQDFPLVHPDDRDAVDAMLRESLAGGGTGSIHRNRNLDRDGAVLECEWQNSWVRDSGGTVQAMLSMAQDVTWQREAVEEVRRLNRELEARVHRRTEELAQANADLKALTYSISHDLRAPVRAVLGFGEILNRRHMERADDEAREYLGHMLRAGEQMNRLIDGLLEYGTVDESVLDARPVALGPLLEGIAEGLGADLSRRGGELHIAPDLPRVTGDPRTLERVFLNLLENAIKYRHPTRGPRIRVVAGPTSGERSSHPDPGHGEDDGMVDVRVEDNGPGIPEAHREKVFDLFQRLETARGVEGSGIGLATVRRAVERLGGRIRIETPGDGIGAAFVLHLPAARRGAQG